MKNLHGTIIFPLFEKCVYFRDQYNIVNSIFQVDKGKNNAMRFILDFEHDYYSRLKSVYEYSTDDK